jgi:hypothetical protein
MDYSRWATVNDIVIPVRTTFPALFGENGGRLDGAN